MRKITMCLMLILALAIGVSATSYNVGDADLDLPQIEVQGNYPMDSSHKTYFACISSLDGDSDVVGMAIDDKCEISARSFEFTEDEIGQHTYVTTIKYVTREWTLADGWQTTSEGIDNSNTFEFDVTYEVPEDDFDQQGWIDGIIQNIQNFLCDNFGLFCEETEPEEEPEMGGECIIDADCAGIEPVKCPMNPIKCISGTCQEVGPVCPF